MNGEMVEKLKALAKHGRDYDEHFFSGFIQAAVACGYRDEVEEVCHQVGVYPDGELELAEGRLK